MAGVPPRHPGAEIGVVVGGGIGVRWSRAGDAPIAGIGRALAGRRLHADGVKVPTFSRVALSPSSVRSNSRDGLGSLIPPA